MSYHLFLEFLLRLKKLKLKLNNWLVLMAFIIKLEKN